MSVYRVDRQLAIGIETTYHHTWESALAHEKQLHQKGIHQVCAWEQTDHVGPYTHEENAA